MHDEPKHQPEPAPEQLPAADPFATSDIPDMPAPRRANASTASYHPEEEHVGMMIGPYKLLQKLGKGGMGVVWMADQTEPVSRRVALKIIKADLRGDQVLARFEAERQALAMMDHPNIAKVLDAGTTAIGRPYFVMELVKGIPFTKFCDQEHLTPKERLELFIPVCNAVQHAHQKGVIHRDLKPSNVLVALYDGKPVPKVIDFGIAKATTQKLTERTLFTEIGQIVGTLEYMAPEQAEMNNLDIDTRADIYSLGVMLYELLAGTLPLTSKLLRGEAFLEMLRLIREVEPQKPSTKISSSEELPAIAAKRKLEPKRLSRLVKGDLDWIVMKCLEKERSRRYETANQLAQELQRFLADEPVQAGPPSVGYRMRKFLRRNQGPVIASALVLMALVVGIVGTSIGLIQAEQARDAEAKQRQRAQANETKANLAAEDAEKAAAAAKLAMEAARYAKKTAEKRMAQIERANALLTAIFNDTDPERKDGPILREQLIKKLSQFADEVNEEMIGGDPRTLVRFQNSLGVILIYYGETAKAIELLSRARNTAEQFFSSEDSDMLTTIDNLATACKADNQPDRAVPLFMAVFEKRNAKFGASDPATLKAMGNLANAYNNNQQYDKAITLHESILKAKDARLGPNHEETLQAAEHLAQSCRNADRLEKAIDLFTQIMDRRKASLPPDHVDTLQAMDNLASAYLHANQSKKAIVLYELALEKRIAKLGPKSREVFYAMDNLGRTYLTIGQSAKGMALLEQVLEKRTSSFGADDFDTLNSMQSLAEACIYHAGQRERGVALYELWLEKYKTKLGSDDPSTLRAMESLVQIYLTTNQPDRAIVLLETALEKCKTRFGPDHLDTIAAADSLASAYLSAKRFDKASQLLKSNLEKRKARFGPAHFEILRATGSLANAYLEAKQFDKAVPLYEANLVKRKARFGSEHPETLRSADSLANAYLEARQFDKAVPLYEANLVKRERLGSEHWETLGSIANLAHAYMESERVEKGVSLYDRYLAACRKQYGGNNLQLSNTLESVGEDFLKHKQFAAAEPILREALDIRFQTQPDAWNTFSTKSLLGGSLLGQKKYADAEPLLMQGYLGLKQCEKAILSHEIVTEALKRLVQLYEVQDKTGEADRWRKEMAARKAAEKEPKK